MFEGMDKEFLVINLKRFEEMRKANGRLPEAVLDLYSALGEFVEVYEYVTGKKLDQKYIVCNQDEPYAERVWKIIKEAGVAPLHDEAERDLKCSIYEQGGSRIWMEEENDGRVLLADTYGCHEVHGIVFEALQKALRSPGGLSLKDSKIRRRIR